MTVPELPSNWRVARLGDVLEPLPNGRLIQQGWSPQCDKDAAGEAEWGVLKTTAIQPGNFDGEHNKRLPAALQPDPSIEVLQGDMLITCAGPRARCGVPCLVRVARPRLMLSGKIYRFRANPAKVDPRYLELYLLSPVAQHRIDGMKTGISDSGLNLTQSRILKLNIPMPPMAEQTRLIEMLESEPFPTSAVTGSMRVRRGGWTWVKLLVDG